MVPRLATSGFLTLPPIHHSPHHLLRKRVYRSFQNFYHESQATSTPLMYFPEPGTFNTVFAARHTPILKLGWIMRYLLEYGVFWYLVWVNLTEWVEPHAILTLGIM